VVKLVAMGTAAAVEAALTALRVVEERAPP
jgi:hypothetical protein